MQKIIFVCSGNTCRSPFAMFYFNKKAAELNLNIRASSAGLSVFSKNKVCQNAITASYAYGVEEEMKKHFSTPITLTALSDTDYIYTMEYYHSVVLKNSITDKIITKNNLKIEVLGQGIPDPYGGSIDDYNKCYDEISKAIDLLIKEISNG